MAEIQIEAVQTVVPTKPTSPKTSAKLLVLPPRPHDLISFPISTPAFHVIIFFHKASPVDCGWLHAALIKESLSLALAEQPIIAGRLRIPSESGEDAEIVSTDSGVRLVEARMETTVKEATTSQDQLQKLVFWEDFTHQNAQFSPLFYVQVTNFNCGGYSLGLSGSLMLVDPFAATSFLKRWITIHQDLVSRNEESKLPLFYHPHLTRTASISLPDLRSNTGSKPVADCVLFTILARTWNPDSKDLANCCVDKAEQEVGRQMSAKFWVLIKGSPENDGEILLVSRSEKGSMKMYDGISMTTTWDELGLDSVCVNRGEKPDHASCWISSSSNEEKGFVFIAPAPDEIKLVVSFP